MYFPFCPPAHLGIMTTTPAGLEQILPWLYSTVRTVQYGAVLHVSFLSPAAVGDHDDNNS